MFDSEDAFKSRESGSALAELSGPSPLLNLPTELHLLISTHLPYPDALALKHTNTHFYALVSTNVRKKVAWLISRHKRRLPCPATKCILTSDTAFCLWAHGEVKTLMERRRKHMECKHGKEGWACEVVVGHTCGGSRMNAIDRLRLGKERVEAWTGRWTLWAAAALVLSIVINVCLIVRSNEATLGVITGTGSFIWQSG